jgi:SAM-dependent methyltransferase
MDCELAKRLARLPRLTVEHGQSTAFACKICAGRAPFFDATDFWKGSIFYPFGPSGIMVSYHRCLACGFMFAPMFDDWTSEDFQTFIYNDEYLAVDGEYAEARPKRVAAAMISSLSGFEDARLMDYGSGTGLFAAEMRAAGFDRITCFDPYSHPTRPAGRFDIITCFEVIEHGPSPLKIIRDLESFLNDDGCIILGESLQPADIDLLRCNWWYCMPRNGHISLYTDQALAHLGAQSGLQFHLGDGMHAFSRPGTGRFADLARRVSAPLLPISLGAPLSSAESGASAKQWHAQEFFSGGPTRWTAQAEITWSVEVSLILPALLRIRIPFVNEARLGFAAQSWITVDGVEVRTSISGRSIVAEAVVETHASIDVTLHTPPPISPSELTASTDLRRLGLAISCFEFSGCTGLGHTGNE